VRPVRGAALARTEPRTEARLPRRLGFALLIVAIGLALACDRPLTTATPDADAPDGWITIRGQRVALELAVTPAEQQLGLGRRDALPWDRGMLFLYREPGFPRFWMKDMRFDIDIVWIRDDRVVDISHGVPHVPGGNGPIVAPIELTDKVLEVNAGYAAAHGWRPGQRVALELHGPWPPESAASPPR